MKKFLLGSLLALTTITSALGCWFTSYNFQENYIAGINNFISHFNKSTTIESAQYSNNMYADLPLTVWIKIAPRVDENGNGHLITKAVLQYRIKKGNR